MENENVDERDRKRGELYFGLVDNLLDGYFFIANQKNGMTVLSDKVVKDFELPGNYLPDMRQFFIDHTFEEDESKYHAALDTLSISEGSESVDLECRIDVPAKGLQ